MNSIIYIAEPRYNGYEGIYPFGGEPMVFHSNRINIFVFGG